MKPSLTLLMPVYNDGCRVVPVISTLFQTVNRELKIITIYDSLDDPTFNVLTDLKQLYPNLEVIKNHWESGALHAIKSGLKEADSEYVGIWVSYHIDPEGKINEMLDLMDQGYDLVSADRFAAEVAHSRGGMVKNFISRTGNLFVSKMLQIPINDLSTSIKVFRKSELDSIKTETNAAFGWSVLVEWSVKMALKGNKLGQIPFGGENLNFLFGSSNFKVTRQIKAYIKWLVFGFKNRKKIRANYHH